MARRARALRIPSYGGCGQFDEFFASGDEARDRRVGDRPDIDGAVGGEGALTEEPGMGQRSVEALIDGRSACCDQFHLGAVQTPLVVEQSHFLVTQVQGPVDVALRLHFRGNE